MPFRTAAVLAILLALCGPAAADPAIAVAGNLRVEADTVRSYFHPGPDGRLDAAALDAGLKKLYATGLFQDVRIERPDGRILVQVVENPLIDRVRFEGNKKLKEEDLKKEVQSRERGPLSRAAVQADVERIVTLYRRAGRFNAKVVAKTIDLKEGRVNLVFEIAEGERAGVRQILFVGNKAYSATKLKGAVKTGETNLLSFLLDNDLYDPDRIEVDRDRLRRFYLDHGYPQVRVTADGRYDEAKKGIVVTFGLDEGDKFQFGTVDIQSHLTRVDATTLKPQLRPRAGDVYSAEAVEKTVEDLSIELARRGEPFAAVQLSEKRQADRHVVALVYTIEEGPRRYVQRIEIQGNGKTRDGVIRREFDFAEGDAYNRALIALGERRLKKLGYFKTVKITSEPGSAPDQVVVKVAVEEQNTGDFSVAGGYSTVDGVIAQVGVSDKNFLGRGELAKASVTLGQYTQAFDLGFTEPYLFDQRLSGGVDLFGKMSSANSYQSYGTTLYGGKVTLGAPLTDEAAAELRYSLYNQSVTLDPASGVASIPIREAALAGPMWVSSIGTGFTYSTLDDPRHPTSGFRSQVDDELAGLGGDARFLRSTSDLRYYDEISNDVVGMLRGQGGYATPWGGGPLPLMDGFFGGPQLVRGFAPNGFGPRDLTPGTTMDNVGGNIYWASTAEVQSAIPFIPPEFGLKAAAFADAGSLWTTGSTVGGPALSQSLQVANSRTVRSSLGVGLVWDSILGPIRVDYAYPTTKASYDVTQRLRFSAGGF